MDALITAQWLADALGTDDLVVLDATYTSTLPRSAKQDPRAEYAAGHIPGALLLDLDTLVDAEDPLPSMLPPRDLFEARMAALGITAESRVVLYDNSQHNTSCRAWWVLGRFGVEAALLDGGIAKWKAEGHPLEQAAPSPARSGFEAGMPQTQVRSLAEMQATDEQVVDARSAARFTGDEPDPRKECAPGHIPGSKNIPQGRFFEADGTWKQPEAIRATFAQAGIDLDKPLVATCGSGITACVIAFAGHLIGRDVPVYDGSWSEWGADPATPKALGPA
ncbi:sulfurtransferase [Sphingomonas psychrotolerans]|uniref:Sulfurtransferase n=1 Tax=Sphingomonas psychrotolerans TaxID=1327635 RepID=A0A2K8MMJ3_9SPHN|nr:sulfurtransferase [Sphingomonas psychrotolerans]ATY33856.1 3-mercaptopyruvate sulfurtransferase [Sphingomonas psychrotolerans]